MNDTDLLEDDLSDLVSAEDFLDYFEIPYEQSMVHVNRLHILQRFHDYMAAFQAGGKRPGHADYAAALQRAYADFVGSSAQEQKVFKVFQSGHTAFVPLDQLGK